MSDSPSHSPKQTRLRCRLVVEIYWTSSRSHRSSPYGRPERVAAGILHVLSLGLFVQKITSVFLLLSLNRTIPSKLGTLECRQPQHSSCSWSPSLRPLTGRSHTEANKRWEKGWIVRLGSVNNKIKKCLFKILIFIDTKCKQTYLYVCVIVPNESYIPLSVYSCRWRWSCTPLHTDSRSCWTLEITLQWPWAKSQIMLGHIYVNIVRYWSSVSELWGHVVTHGLCWPFSLGGCRWRLCLKPPGLFSGIRAPGAAPLSSGTPSASCTVWLLQRDTAATWNTDLCSVMCSNLHWWKHK